MSDLVSEGPFGSGLVDLIPSGFLDNRTLIYDEQYLVTPNLTKQYIVINIVIV